ncbi:hypothetical protein [Citricoccus sp. NR2]|uniref:hypothetical protein n=1 Tax=Citricoccus sp. NR2 TaxID=3004095 RepID=UPI0022DD5B6D|nr:hypothetical protein [Citricoccus sp. NR2]WBL19790.1 hypothetical protein O1A05_03600 [Citricoccus sp. NR2]
MSTATQHLTTITWSQSLEEWCTEKYGVRAQKVSGRTEFAPYDAHRPERYRGVPAVLVVLTSATRHLHANFAEALDLIRTATSGFRAVLVTDDYHSTALTRSDWPTEQILPESSWLRQHHTNWLASATDQVRAAQRYFGASFVVAPSGTSHARDLLKDIARAYNAQQPVLDAALTLFDQDLSDPTGVNSGYRGGWQAIEESDDPHSTRRFISGDGVTAVTANLLRGRGHGVVVDHRGLLTEGLRAALESAGWGIAELTEETSTAEGDNPFTRGAALACADALRHAGPAVLIDDVVSGSMGSLRRGESQDVWELDVDQLGRVSFTEENAERVLSEVGRLYAGLFG